VSVKGQGEGTQTLDTGRQRWSERKWDLLGQGGNDKLGPGKRYSGRQGLGDRRLSYMRVVLPPVPFFPELFSFLTSCPQFVPFFGGKCKHLI
jgi:hypothetical protein